jgi:hypothetical protein
VAKPGAKSFASVLDESGARAQYFTQHNRTVPDPRYPHSASPLTFWNLLNSLFIWLPSPPVVASRSFFKLFLHSPTAPSSFAVQHIKRSQHQPVRLTLRRNPLFFRTHRRLAKTTIFQACAPLLYRQVTSLTARAGHPSQGTLWHLLGPVTGISGSKRGYNNSSRLQERLPQLFISFNCS